MTWAGCFVGFCITWVTVWCENTLPIKCIQGDGSDKNAQDCAGDFATATQCSQPKFVQYTGISPDVPYSCGPCPDEQEGVTCESCEGSSTEACNVKKETGEDFKCHDYEYVDGAFKIKEEPTVCQRLPDTEIKCNMPGENAGEHYETKKGGCGDCPYMERQAGQCVQCDTDQCNRTPIKCIQGKDADATPRMCVPLAGEDPPTVCHRPKLKEYTGFPKDLGYGCGPCPSGATDETCETCEGNTTSACNTKMEIGRNFNCTNYKKKDDAFIVDDETTTVTCWRFESTKMICNKPGEAAEALSQYELGNHCGPCKTDDKASGICEETDPVPIKCNVGQGIIKNPEACKRSSDDQDIPIKCHQTKFIQYFGLAEEVDTYGCGECPAGKEDKCQECFGNTDKPCNKEIPKGNDYTCYDYEYNTKGKKFVKKEEMVICQRLNKTAPKCNMPGKNATAASDYENSGCGGCTEAEMAAVTCSECGTVQCNTGHTHSILAAFILPLFCCLFVVMSYR